MKQILLLLTVISIISCSSVKKTQEALNTGNYDNAIYIALEKLRDNKSKKGNQPYVEMLEEAYAKAVDRDLEQIRFMEKENNPANLEAVYQKYTQLSNRQDLIKPLLPLPVHEKGRNARFSFNDYSDQIIRTKNKLSDYLYANALIALKKGNKKSDFRNAFQDLEYINKINPGFRDVAAKMEEAHIKGTDYVKVAMFNDSEMVIPQNLEAELLNFSTYGINNFWTVYHAQPVKNIHYDYEMELAFKNILISPEQVKEKELVKEKQIKDGWKYLLDSKGDQVKDSLGNAIKVDNFKTIRCNFYEFTQFKAVNVTGVVAFKDLKTKQTINSYPLTTEYVFQHRYGNYKGDKRALEEDFISLLEKRSVVFPSNEQMVYDAGEDIKSKLKSILSRQQFM